MATQVNIQGLITSLSTGTQKIGIIPVANSNNVGAVTNVAMSASIAASVSVPLLSVGVIIVPPTNNPTTISFKTSANSGDTGLPISPTQASLFAFATTIPTSMTFAFGATFAGTLKLQFF